jgi:TRAP-type C4-dicarboxylate transport system substrate-binding protein
MQTSRWLAALAVVAGLSGAVQAQTAPTVLRASSWVPPGHMMHREVMVPWVAAVEQATQGRVRVEILPRGVASPAGHFDAIRDGLADVTFNVHGYVPGRFTLTKLPELPFLGDSAEALSVAYWRIHERHLSKAGEHRGLKVLALFTHGPGQIYNAKKPIASLADLAGLKFRVGGGMVSDVASAVGATTLLKPAPESYELMAGGVIDGVFFPAESIEAFKIDKFIKHATLIPGGLYNTSFAFFMNEERFAKLPKADQDAILSVSGENFSRAIGRAWDARDRAAHQVLAGVTTVPASPAFVAELRARTSALEADWVKAATAKGLDGAKVLAEFKDEVRKAGAK